MTPKKPVPPPPKKYASGPSGKHKRPSMVVRPETQEELDAWTRAAEREGVTRNDWLCGLANAAAGRIKPARRPV